MKRGRIFPIVLWAAVLLFPACRDAEKKPLRFDDLLVGVEGNLLTRSQVESEMPSLRTAADSARFVDAYVKQWIGNELLYRQAEKNLPDMARIEERVEAYRRSLVLYEYQRLLVNERLSREIPESEKEAYYQNHLADFKLGGSLLRGIFLKVPEEAPQIDQIKKWMRNPTPDAVEKIEKYSLRNGVVYDYFPEKWVAFADVMDNIPYTVTNEANFVKEKKFFELKENGFWYLLSITDYLPKGATEPFDFARTQIEEMLVNRKRLDFLKSIGEDLYRTALDRDGVAFYQWRDTTGIQ